MKKQYAQLLHFELYPERRDTLKQDPSPSVFFPDVDDVPQYQCHKHQAIDTIL